jgi:alkanesulfonate monooxygenase SsuD/methylene tetrahydromethanopterin reductase-like flavin-dependent oxidoreductase (luciferase family)
MQFGIDIPNFGIYSDPRLLAELAQAAAEATWDGFFLCDHITYTIAGSPVAIADPWIQLAAIAMSTKRIKIGPMVTPLPRRRPWKLARETVTLDHLAQGRLILGVGLGNDQRREYSAFSETADPKMHGEMLDEGLEVLTKCWSGEAFSYDGRHYHLSQVQFLPKPFQQPHIPLWIAGNWPNKKPFRRAAQWSGVFPYMLQRALRPEDFREMLAYIQTQRTLDTPFDVIASGQTSGLERAQDMATVASFAQAGATWWLESFSLHHPLEQVRQRIHQGPPRA